MAAERYAHAWPPSEPETEVDPEPIALLGVVRGPFYVEETLFFPHYTDALDDARGLGPE